MNTVPVLWLSLHKPEIIARGYWDGAWLEQLFDGSMWKAINQMQFSHYEDPAELPSGSGAVVVVPGRWHTSSEDVSEIQLIIERLPWVLLVVTGDEEAVFPVWRLKHPHIKVWVQTPDPAIHARADVKVGDFAPPKCREILKNLPTTDKDLDWFFAGQEGSVSRREFIEALRNLSGTPAGILQTTAGFAQGQSADTYYSLLARSKVAPAPSGPFTPDTFRLFEALEAGCIPIAQSYADKQKSPGYWNFIFQGPIPFPIIEDTSQLEQALSDAVEAYPSLNNHVSAWWQSYKRHISYQFMNHLEELVGLKPPAQSPSQLITVLIPTSPVKANPGYDHLEEVIESIRQYPDLADAEILLMIDGVRAEQEDYRQAYEEFIRRVLWKTNLHWGNVLPVLFEKHTHQANMTKFCLEIVKTPLVLFVEHDTPLEGPIDWARVAMPLIDRQINVLRFHHETVIQKEHKHLMLDDEPRPVRGVPTMRTVQWSQRPHLARKDFYRWMIHEHFGSEALTMIEDVMHGVVYNQYTTFGEEAWRKFKLYLYAPDGSLLRSRHSDARQNDPKFRMKFHYDSPETPAGAPHPKRDE